MSGENDTGANETKTEDRSTSLLGGTTAPDAKSQNGATGHEKPVEGDTKAEVKAEGADDKAAVKTDDKSKPAVIDDKWEPKPVEGITRDAKQLGEARALFKKLGFTAEQSQALVEYSDAQTKAAQESAKAREAEAAKEFEAERNKGWAAIKADKEVGGEKFPESVGHARAAVAGMGPHADAVRDRMVELGIDNDPVLARGFIELGRRLAEDTVADTADKAGVDKPDTFEDRVGRTYSKQKES
jgi:hypothetical protein